MNSKFKQIVQIIIGNAFIAVAYAKIMVPDKIINGGVTSLAMILAKLVGGSVSILVNVLLVCLLCLCLWISKEMFVNSFVSSVSFFIFFNIAQLIAFDFTTYLMIDFLISVIFISLGYFLCLSAHASTLGLDVVALVIQKKKPKLRLAHIIRYLNYLVLGAGFFVYGLYSVLIGIIFAYCYSKLLNEWFKLKERKRGDLNASG